MSKNDRDGLGVMILLIVTVIAVIAVVRFIIGDGVMDVGLRILFVGLVGWLGAVIGSLLSE